MIPHLKSAKGQELFALNVQIQHPLRKRRVEFGRLTIGLSLCIFIFVLGLYLVFSANTAAANLPSTPEDPSQIAALLIPGETIEQELSPGAVHKYRFGLPAGHYLRLTIEQKTVSVASTLFDTNGKTIVAVDYAGKQSLSVISIANSTKSEAYQVEIRARLRNQSGRYLIKIEEQRPAIPRDADRMEAEKLVAQANQEVRQRNGQTGLRLAVELYRKALPLWRSTPVQRDDQSAEPEHCICWLCVSTI